MNVQEIRERLEKYNKGRVTGSVRVVGSFADWMAEELERQLDRNHELDKQLTEIKEAGEPIEIFTSRFGSDTPDDFVISVAGIHHTLGSVCLVFGELRRLAKALNKIEEVKG